MRLRTKLFAVTAFLLVAAWFLNACSAGTSSPGSTSEPKPAAPVKNTSFTFVDATDVSPMDPAFVTDTLSGIIMNLVYDKLVVFKDEKLTIGPQLATSWTVSEDVKTFTFKLRTDVKFQDGTSFDAEAVKYHFERLLDPKVASAWRSILSPIKEIKVVDSSTVTFVMSEPMPDFLVNLAGTAGNIVSPTAAKKAANPKDFGTAPVGSGPFKVQEWLPGEHTILVANPDYWGEKPYMQKLTYKAVPEPSTRSAMLKRGEADMVLKVPLEEVDALAGTQGMKAAALPSMWMISYEILTTKKPFDDVRVRQAMNHAVDKDAIVKNVFGGKAKVTDGPVPAGLDYRKSFTPYAYDPQKAKQLLAEAGYPNGFKMTLWSPNGRYLKDREVSEAVVGYLKAVGIEAELKLWEWSPYLQAIRTEERQVVLNGRASPGFDYTVSRLLLKKGWDSSNLTRYYNPRVEELLATGRSTLDPAKRAQAYTEVQETVWKDAPFLYVHNQFQTYGAKADVEGFVLFIHEFLDLRGIKRK